MPGVIFAASRSGSTSTCSFARHYEVGSGTASSAMLISTALAMLTITFFLLLLPPVMP
jgi:predicted permease